MIHTVTFRTGGGSAVAAKQVHHGNPVEKSADPTRAEYSFAGWYSDAAFTTRYDFTTPVTENLTLYAKWTKNTEPPVPVIHTVTFRTGGGSAVAARQVHHGNPVEKPADPTRAEYSFAGWYSDAAFPTRYDFTTPVTENLTLYAKWTKKTDPKPPTPPTGITTERIFGDNRIQTAIALSKDTFTKANTVVLARSDDYPDALTAAVLARAVDAPVLLTHGKTVHPELQAELTRLGAKHLLVIGGEAAISKETADAYGQGRSLTRIGGKNRYDTAALVADAVIKEVGKQGVAMIATGENYPDAIAISADAASRGIPILLVRQGGVPKETAAALTRNSITKTTVIGGDAAVSEACVNQLPGTPVRLGGKNRYDTAAVIAAHFHKTAHTAYLATGEKFPDALTAGLVAARNHAPLLLTKRDELRNEARAYFTKAGVKKVILIGGTNAITDRVVKDMK